MSRRSLNPSESHSASSAPRQSSGQANRPPLTSPSGQQRSADGLRLALPPLQFDSSRSSGPSTAHAILHPTSTPGSLEHESQSGQGPYAQATASAGQQYGRGEAAPGVVGSQHYGQQQSHYRPIEPHRQNSSASSIYPQQAGSQWYPPHPQSHSTPSSGGAYFRETDSQSVPPSQYGPPSNGSWQMEQQSRAPSSAYGERAASASSAGQPQHNQTYVLDLPHGPMSLQVNTQSASKAADEKRKRNAGASARFRQRRKEKEQASTREIEELRQELDDREKQIEYYRSERDYFAGVVANGSDRGRIGPRPPSPPRSRPFVPRAESSRTSSPGSSTTYQEQGLRESEGSYTRRRLTDDGLSRQLPPQQQQPTAGQYGYGPGGGRLTGYSYPSQEPQYQYPQRTQQPQQQYGYTLPPPQGGNSRPEYQGSGTSLPERTYQQQGQAGPGQRWAPSGR